MMWFLVLLIVVVLGFTYLMGTGWFGEMPTPSLDEPTSDVLTSDGPLTANDLRRVSFPVVTRGYSMRQVDALLARLADQIGGRTGDELDDPADLAEVADLIAVDDEPDDEAENQPLRRNESAVSSFAE